MPGPEGYFSYAALLALPVQRTVRNCRHEQVQLAVCAGQDCHRAIRQRCPVRNSFFISYPPQLSGVPPAVHHALVRVMIGVAGRVKAHQRCWKERVGAHMRRLKQGWADKAPGLPGDGQARVASTGSSSPRSSASAAAPVQEAQYLRLPVRLHASHAACPEPSPHYPIVLRADMS